jgi:hypothetical protein
VSKHRQVKKTAGRTCTVATALIASSLLFAPLSVAQDPATNAIGVGGFLDPGAQRIPAKINGFAGTFASYTPIVSKDPLATPFTWSVAQDVPALEAQIRQNAQNGDNSAVITYSRGTLVAAQVQRNFANDPNAPAQDAVVFYYIATPNNPDGGLYSRYPGLPIPGLAFDGALPETKYTTYIVYREYDPYADSPDDILNPLSALNSLMGVRYAHPDQYYDTMSQADLDALGATKSGPLNSAGGATIVYRLPSQQLPLLGPVREISSLFGTTGLTEPFVKLVEPTLKWGVDLGYDRTNDESVATSATPGSSLLRLPGALPGLPGAVQQGVQDAVSEAPSATQQQVLSPSSQVSTNQVVSETSVEPSNKTTPKETLKQGSETGGLDMRSGGKVTPGAGDTSLAPRSGNVLSGVSNAVGDTLSSINKTLGSLGKPSSVGSASESSSQSNTDSSPSNSDSSS